VEGYVISYVRRSEEQIGLHATFFLDCRDLKEEESDVALPLRHDGGELGAEFEAGPDHDPEPDPVILVCAMLSL